MIDFKSYWADKKSNMNRREDSNYYDKKATEHISFISQYGKSKSVTDFGCGAGELLSRYVDLMPADYRGIDFSDSLLRRARETVPESVVLENANALQAARLEEAEAWTACGSVNQYLSELEMVQFFEAFEDNEMVKSVYLFDTIDPSKYVLFSLELLSSYNARPALNGIKYIFRVLRSFSALLTFNPNRNPVVPLGNMGYGYQTAFWMALADEKGWDVEIVSSFVFEYRYHVRISKKD